MMHPRGPHWYVLIMAALLGLVGYYGPWVPHPAAGLVILGLDLAEYVKFLPQVRSGQIALQREIFYLPLLAASVMASLLAGRRTLRPVVRGVLALAAIPLALAMLPPAWSPATLTQSEFRLQMLAIALCLLLVPGVLLTRHLSSRLVLVLVAILSLLAAILPAWGFLRVKPPIEELYGHALSLGWGFWACLGGFLAAAVIALAESMGRRP